MSSHVPGQPTLSHARLNRPGGSAVGQTNVGSAAAPAPLHHGFSTSRPTPSSSSSSSSSASSSPFLNQPLRVVHSIGGGGPAGGAGSSLMASSASANTSAPHKGPSQTSPTSGSSTTSSSWTSAKIDRERRAAREGSGGSCSPTSSSTPPGASPSSVPSYPSSPSSFTSSASSPLSSSPLAPSPPKSISSSASSSDSPNASGEAPTIGAKSSVILEAHHTIPRPSVSGGGPPELAGVSLTSGDSATTTSDSLSPLSSPRFLLSATSTSIIGRSASDLPTGKRTEMAVRYTTARYSAGVEVTGTPPSPRWGHSAVRYDDLLIVFGGRNDAGQVLSDCFIFNFATRSWSCVETPNSKIPPARWGHAAVLYKEKMYVMGGQNESGHCLNDTWHLSLDTSQWTKVSLILPPAPRKLHSASVYNDAIYIFGGLDAQDNAFNDAWSYESTASMWLEVRTQGEPPAKRGGHTAVIYKNSLFIFGGKDGSKEYDDLWELKLLVGSMCWQKVPLSEQISPAARSGHTSVVLRDVMYMAGGDDDDDSNAIYEFSFDYRKWCKIITTGDPVSKLSHQTMSIRGDAIFIFGGLSNGGASGHLDYLCLGKDEFLSEESNLEEEYEAYPRSEWESIILRRHPDILELRERLRPLTGLPSFSRMARTARTENRNALSHKVMLQLIMEHLENEQCKKTLQTIQRESNLLYVKPSEGKIKESQLVTLLRLSQIRLRSHQLKSVDIFAAELPKPYEDEFDKEVEVIDHLPGRAKDEETDVNVWDEPPDSEKNIIKVLDKNQKLEIQAGTLNKLIEQLVPDADKPLDLHYIKIFVHTHQSFMTSQTFLKKLVQRYQVPVPKGMSREEYQSKVQEPMVKRICNVIKYWVDKAWGDFTDSSLLFQLNAFIDGSLARDGFHQYAHTLRAVINKNKMNKMDEKIFISEPPEPKVSAKIFSTKLNTKQIDDEELARQLTLMHFELYQSIQPSEFMNKSWLDPHLRYKAPNIIAMMKAYEDISLWVGTEILFQDKARRRVKLLKKFIDIAKHLRQLNNFHTLFAVLAGLNLPPVQSLNRAFSEIPLQTQSVFSELVKLVPPREGEALAYQEALEKSASEGHLPLLPYLDVVLRNILLIEDSVPSRTKNNLINFEKRVQLYGVIQKVQEHQRRLYNLQPVHQVRVILEESIRSHKRLKELEIMASRLE